MTHRCMSASVIGLGSRLYFRCLHFKVNPAPPLQSPHFLVTFISPFPPIPFSKVVAYICHPPRFFGGSAFLPGIPHFPEGSF